MIERLVENLLLKRLVDFPAVSLVGPRQCGKTTLARSLAGKYFDLELEADRLRLDLEWDRLAGGAELVILDEAQAWPAIFTRLRGAIDNDRRRTGRFLLLGSVSPSLMIQVSESLAGRLSLIELTPFLLQEILPATQRERLWFFGGFPDGGVQDPRSFPQWQIDYLRLLAQRDLPNWGLPAKPQLTERLLRMLAALNGQVWNASQLGQSLGISYKTVGGYLDYLEGAYLIRRLPPFHANIRKRLVKSPKIYWRDSGLVHALLGLADPDQLLLQPWVGASFEAFVIEQILGHLTARGKSFQAYFFRTHDRHEIDLVLETGRDLWAVEIKLTSSPGLEEIDRLERAAELIGAGRRAVVSTAAQETTGRNTLSCNLETFLNRI